MAEHRAKEDEKIWACLHCRGPLTSGRLGMNCRRCGKEYPVVAGIPLLVRQPDEYFRAECISLSSRAREVRQRRESIGRIDPYADLPRAALERHRDVLSVVAAQAESLLALLEPSAPALETPTDDASPSQVVRPG